jgi:hypothetical protein
MESRNWEQKFVKTENQLKSVLNFGLSIFDTDECNALLATYPNWVKKLDSESYLMVYATIEGKIVSAVIGYSEAPEKPESLILGLVCCDVK